MNLSKRDCGIKMRLVPYGGGWTDVFIDFGEGELYFIISYAMGDSFEALMKALYFLNPNNIDSEDADELVEYKFGICERIDGEYVVTKIKDDTMDIDFPAFIKDIPWKASFTWDEEGSCSVWTLERIPNEETTFKLKVSIDICRDETSHYEYEVQYEDMCYAVAAACTSAIKKHGFWGYHHAAYTADMNVRYLLFLKAIGLNNMEARKLTFYEKKGLGETSDFNKEMELLLFDM